ncbi:MAG: hypothetical protein QOH76_1557 [Thermoleophilaceae bacterium]|nr:hypothetical protein [Thermoleophilaceae bacterium]
MLSEPYEGEWIYVSVPLAHLNGTARALSDQIKVTIRSRGWTVLSSDIDAGTVVDERERARLHEALRSADACIFDVSSSSVAPEMREAVDAGRPVIALEHVDNPPLDELTSLLDSSKVRRVIRYKDANWCVDELSETLRDPAWLAAVGFAAADVR